MPQTERSWRGILLLGSSSVQLFIHPFIHLHYFLWIFFFFFFFFQFVTGSLAQVHWHFFQCESANAYINKFHKNEIQSCYGILCRSSLIWVYILDTVCIVLLVWKFRVNTVKEIDRYRYFLKKQNKKKQHNYIVGIHLEGPC